MTLVDTWDNGTTTTIQVMHGCQTLLYSRHYDGEERWTLTRLCSTAELERRRLDAAEVAEALAECR